MFAISRIGTRISSLASARVAFGWLLLGKAGGRETGHRARHELLNFERSDLALDAAIEGHGVAIAPTYMLEDDVNRNRLVKVWVSPEQLSEHLYVSWSDGHVGQPYVRRIVEWITSGFGPE